MGKYETSVRPRLAEIRQKLAEGISLTALAGELGIALSTLARMRKQHPELEELFLEAAGSADDQVEAALLRRATGYESDGKEIPPDVRAAVFWLKNRRPEQWKDRRELSVAEPVAVTFKTEEKEL